MHYSKYVSVILDVSLDKTLDYGVPDELTVQRGVRVEVPVRGHLRSGYVVSVKDSSEFPSIKPIAKVSQIKIPEALFELALWMAKYYCTPLRQVLKIIVPASIRSETKLKQQLFVARAKTREELSEYCKLIRNKSPAQADVLDVMLKVTKGILLTELLEQTQGSRSPVDALSKKGFLTLESVRTDKSPLINEEYLQSKPKKLNENQTESFIKIVKSIEESRYETHLLYGVTGSGKTEVYLQAIEKALQLNKSAIMLVPEIALTAQTIERFRSRFSEPISVLHCRLSQGERNDEWLKISRGESKIVIGARSAVFSPTPNLGLIIVDEEHDQSYKQMDEMPCYHARDVAVMRGRGSNATVILGSATPSLESYYNAQQNKYTLSKLAIRADAATMPKVTIVDMQREFEKAQGFTNFSELLLDGIKRRSAVGEQTILFLNRRGYHTTLLCQHCRSAVKCNHCDVALTFHMGSNVLACHLCGFSITPPTCCPKCQQPSPMKYKGVGTELIEKSLHAILPDIRTLRIDADTTRHKGSHQKLFKAFATGKADLLIGTQMIAKGLHFPEVTLVGVLNSDSSLNIPDFRASETVFQLVTQVAGRSGRGTLPGEVIVQTCMPENSTIQHASKQDYEGFFNEEIEARKMFAYPPYMQLVKFVFSGSDERKTFETAEQMRKILAGKLPASFELHPSIPAGHAKVKDRYRFQFLVKGPAVLPINRAVEIVQQEMQLGRDVRVKIDVNPMSTFF